MNAGGYIAMVGVVISVGLLGFMLGQSLGRSQAAKVKASPITANLRCPSCSYGFSITVQP